MGFLEEKLDKAKQGNNMSEEKMKFKEEMKKNNEKLDELETFFRNNGMYTKLYSPDYILHLGEKDELYVNHKGRIHVWVGRTKDEQSTEDNTKGSYYIFSCHDRVVYRGTGDYIESDQIITDSRDEGKILAVQRAVKTGVHDCLDENGCIKEDTVLQEKFKSPHGGKVRGE